MPLLSGFEFFRRFFKCRKAVTVVEYALIAAGISAVIVSVIFFFGDEMGVTLVLLTESMETAGNRIDSD